MAGMLIGKMLCSASIATLGFAMPAFAQEAGNQGTPQAEEDSVSTGDIIVTAQRREERLRDVPISVTALNEDMLSKAGVTNTVEIAKVAPGVSLPFYGGFLQPSIRGISSSLAGLGDSPNVAIYVDGVYQASQSGALIDLPDVESVQVLKGPQGSLYGQNAAGGAIIINSVAPSFTLKGKLSASYGNFKDVNLNGYVTGPLSETLAVSLAGAYRNREGINRDLLRGGHDDGLRSHLIRGKLLWQPSDSASLTLSGFYSKRDDSGVYSGAPLNGNSLGVAIARLPCNFGGLACLNVPIADEPYEVAINPGADTRIKSYGVSLLGKFDIGDIGTLSTVSSYKRVDVLDLVDLDQTPVNTVGVYLAIGERDYIQELNFASRDFGGLTFSVGMFYMDKAETYDQNFALIYPSGPGGLFNTAFPALPRPVFTQGAYSLAKKQSWAGYAEASYQVTEQLSLTLAGRYSHETSKVANTTAQFNWQPGDPQLTPLPDPRGSFTFTKFTPRAVLRYKPSDDHTLYASFSKGFKSGFVNGGNVNNCTPLPLCVDPPVAPENVDAYEIGYKGRIADILDLNLAAFHYIYKDIQVFIYDPLNVSRYQNAARGQINGFEFGAVLRATPELTLSAGGAYLDAKYKSFPQASVFNPNGFGNTQSSQNATGKRLMRTPEWTVNGSFNYLRDLGGGELGLYGGISYNSGIFFDPNNRVRQPAYALVDAELSFAPEALRGARIIVWGKNLTNKAVLQSVLESGIGDAVSYSDPQTYGVRLEYRF